MGKRIELTAVFRAKPSGPMKRAAAPKPVEEDQQPGPASASGRPSGFGPENARSNRAAGAKLPLSPVPTTAAELKAALVEAGLASEDDFTTTPKFDRTRYQRDYMRDLTQAKKQGITVAEYRKQKETT